MAQYFETSMELVDLRGMPLKHYGTKIVEITQPSEYITTIIQNAFPSSLSTNRNEADEQLVYANTQLRKTLPFLFSNSYREHNSIDSRAKMKRTIRHFWNSKQPRTLGELSDKLEMECSEQALAVREVQLPEWQLYRHVKRDGTPSRHIILAHQFKDEPYMMIVDPTARALSAGLDGKSFMAEMDEFHKRYRIEHLQER